MRTVRGVRRSLILFALMLHVVFIGAVVILVGRFVTHSWVWGCIAAVGGILLALFVSGAYPNFAFWTTSGEAIFMILLGGSNVFLGPLVGTVILRVLNDVTIAYTSHTDLVLGIVILVLVLGLRKGPLDVIAERLENRRQTAAQKLRDAADAVAAEER